MENISLHRHFKVLVADDSSFIRKTISSKMIKKGVREVFEAEDGNETVELYVKHRPNLVIMDIKMPNMDGLSALSKIKKIDPNAKIVVLTANSQDWIINKAKEEGALICLNKQFRPDILSEIILGLLEMKEERGPSLAYSNCVAENKL
ncbi:MAG: response regulator [Candidatus Methanomethylicaceae archaeon]